MRLRKTFKQTAAAALALSMTVSSTTPAMATYYCDLNQGDVTIIVSDAGEKTITVGETEIKNTGDGDDIIIYDGRNENSYPKENSDGPNAPSPAAETNESSESDEDGFSDSEIIESSEIGSNKSVDEESSDKIEDEPTQSSAKSISSDTIREKQADDSAIESESHDISDSAEDTPTENKALSAFQEDCKTDSEPVEQDAESVKVENTSEDTSASLPSLKNIIKIINNWAKETLDVTLDNIKIDVSDTGSSDPYNDMRDAGKNALSVEGTGNTSFELDGDNELKSGIYRAGLQNSSSIEIKDANDKSGTLTAVGGSSGSGIGNDYNQNSSSTVIINGGTIHAQGGDNTAGSAQGNAGIGSSTIIINDGTVNAIGGGYAGAGIGGVNNGTVIINDGQIEAIGSARGAGIGGNRGQSSQITINGGNITASSAEHGAGIGGSEGGSGTVTITGGTIQASGGNWGSAGIGGGSYGSGNVTITGGNITATGGTGNLGGAGIGGGGGKNGTVTISGGTITATGGDGTNGKNGGAAGIGGGGNGGAGFVEISNATIIKSQSGSDASGSVGGAGIGNGSQSKLGFGGFVKIINSVIGIFNKTANGSWTADPASGAIGGSHAAGIGNGSRNETANGESDVTISGKSYVSARGGNEAEAIGDGSYYDGTDWTIGERDKMNTDALDDSFTITHPEDDPVSGESKNYTVIRPIDPIPQPEPGQPDTPAAAVPAALHLRVVDANGADVTFETRTESGNYIVDARRDGLDTATLLAPLPVLRELQASGAESITFVTTLKTTTLSLSALLALGGEDDEAQLLHTGDVPTLTVGGTVHNELL